MLLLFFFLFLFFFFKILFNYAIRDSCDIGFRVQFNVEFPRQVMNFSILSFHLDGAPQPWLRLTWINKAVFKWLSKNQNRRNYSDQSQQEQTARWTNHKFLAIRCNSLEAWEKSRARGAIGFCFASHWLKNWHDSFKVITKRSDRNHVITFDSNLKTTLTKAISFPH